MKFSDLTPGMKVKNKLNGNIAEIHKNKDGKIEHISDWYVMVRSRRATGKNIGKYQYAYWVLYNLERVN